VSVLPSRKGNRNPVVGGHSSITLDPTKLSDDPLQVIESFFERYADGSEVEMVRLADGQEISAVG
jgi:hypothetical protein